MRALTLAWLVVLACPANAQTWNGGSLLDSKWSSGGILGLGGNWNGAAAPTNDGTANVAFAGSTRLTPDMDANWSINSLTFNSGAGAFTLDSTGSFTLTIQGGSITNNSTNTETINNAVTLGAAQTWSATSGNLAFGGNIANGGFLLTISGSSNTSVTGVISGTGGLTKSGTGILTLSGANTFTGGTTLTLGTLKLSGSGTLGGTSGALTVNGGTLDLNGTSQGVGNFTGSGGTILNNSTGTNVTLTIGNSNGTGGTYSGVIADHTSGTGTVALTKTGTGTIALSGANTYTRATTINAGTLSVSSLANGGSSSNIGASTSAATNLVLNGGTLQYTGAAVSTDRLFSVGTSGGTIDASGTGAVNFTNTGSMGFNSQTGTRTLTLTGSNTGSNTIAAIIGDNSGATSLVKSGAGTWVLSGLNTYTGTTTINAGTLLVNGSLASGSAVTVNNSGSILGGTGTINGSVSIASNGAILEGGTGSTGQTLTIKGSLTQVSGSIIELALGPSLTHSTLALTSAGTSSFYSTQKFTFIDLGATTGTYQDLITGVTSNPGSLSGWTITNAGFTGAFSWDSGDGGIDLTLTNVPEPSTWIAAGLALAAIACSQRKRFTTKSIHRR